jgi:hypothetical protein
VAITPPRGKNVQQSPLVMGANATGVFSSRAQILRSLAGDGTFTCQLTGGGQGAAPALWPPKEFSQYLSSATVARYKPSGEKHTDLRELMWTSLSSMAGSSWVWLQKKQDSRPEIMATLPQQPHPYAGDQTAVACGPYKKPHNLQTGKWPLRGLQKS